MDESPTDRREQIARLLYEREAARSANATAIARQINPNARDHMEPFEQCADVWYGDAEAVLALLPAPPPPDTEIEEVLENLDKWAETLAASGPASETLYGQAADLIRTLQARVAELEAYRDALIRDLNVNREKWRAAEARASAAELEADHQSKCAQEWFERHLTSERALTALREKVVEVLEPFAAGEVYQRPDCVMYFDAARRLYDELTAPPAGKQVGEAIPEPPWPVGSDTNCKRAGWEAFFKDKSREACPFPPGRRDLREGYVEGWDAASAYANGAPPAGEVETCAP